MPSGPRLSRRQFVRLGLGLAGGTGLYAATLGSHWVETTRHRVPLPGLPEALRGTRLVQLTDFHHSPWISERYLRHVVELTNALRPDLVALTGDFIDHHHRYAQPCARILSSLRPRLGCFCVLGNHDHWHGLAQTRAALAEAGLPELRNRAVAVDAGLYVAGLDDLWIGQPEPARLRAEVPDGAACLLLSHNPRILPIIADRPWLVLAGHTHGSQVSLPFIRPVVPPDMYGTPYVKGWYGEARARMYVSRGIGMSWPAVRFRCHPEISLFELEPAPQS